MNMVRQGTPVSVRTHVHDPTVFGQSGPGFSHPLVHGDALAHHEHSTSRTGPDSSPSAPNC
jgi:hypothetical protein